MPERIYKLQPDRTLALRGFDDLGASAALHSATPSSFKVSGNFRDAADFAVLLLHDADNFYEHPRLKYLPDFNFAGLTLSFDVRYSGLIPLDSPKYPSISWPYLEVIRKDESKAQIRLYAPDPERTRAIPIGGTRTAARTSFTVIANTVKEYDRLTLWYQNLALDYIVPKVECAFAFAKLAAGHVHTITVAGQTYSYTEQAADTDASVATGIVAALGSCSYVTAASDSLSPNQVNIRARRDDGIGFDVAAAGQTHILHGVGASAVAADIATQINRVDWSIVGSLIALRATSDGPTLTITAQTAGEDGNMLAMYATWKNERLRTQNATAKFSGGVAETAWHVTLDFSALGIPEVRQMWLTFAPPLANSSAFEGCEWEAEFTNWTVLGPESVRRLQVAGPQSIRIEENDAWCSYTGDWQLAQGFYSGGFARTTAQPGATVTAKYVCSSAHDVYLGTTLSSGAGALEWSIDGGPWNSLSCRLDDSAGITTRRLLRPSLMPGEHRVAIRHAAPGILAFDFIEAAVPSDVPDGPAPDLHVSPALDYSTDHTYKLSPARLHWIFDKLGFAAPMNEYIGVFWWNQRRREGAVTPQATVTFSGSFAAGDQIFLKLGPPGEETVFGKTVFPTDTNPTIARHFEQFINGYSVAVWASASDNVLSVTGRSARSSYLMPLKTAVDAVTGSTGQAVQSGSLEAGATGVWIVDPEQNPPLNRGARDWHSDMFRECARRNREITVACSMELVNPPEPYASVFPDGEPVVTSVGFGSLNSTHCAFTDEVLEYQKRVFAYLAWLMANAGITPNLQCGEFLWWFFSNRSVTNADGGMGYYHADIVEDAKTALGRPLIGFVLPTDDPKANGAADANFLQRRLRDHVAALVTHVRAQQPSTKFEVLFPYDVNHPQPAGIHNLGGQLNLWVNFPAEWRSKETCGFDRLKMEALDFGAWSRDLDLARTAIDFPLDLGWPAASVRHLVPIFKPGYRWDKEVEIALASGIPVVNLWAFDHVCLFNLPVGARSTGRSSFSE